MIKIAAPVSHLFEDPDAAKRIIASCDCLECRERSVGSGFAHQELFHLDVDLTMPWSDERREYLSEAFDLTPGLRLISFQMTSCYDGPVIRDRMYYPGGRRIGRDELLSAATENISWLKRRIGESVALAVENNNFYPTAAYDDVTDADFIDTVVRGNGIRLLLDVAHAIVTAHNRKIALEDYLERLPLDEVIQLHLCTPGVDSAGIARDEHDPPDERVYALAEELIGRTGLKYLTVEYYRDVERLIEAHETLRVLIAKTETGGAS